MGKFWEVLFVGFILGKEEEVSMQSIPPCGFGFWTIL
jgi:hypothetical protein